MTGFCVREMRKEYRGVSRLYAGTALLFLTAFACFSVIMRVRDADIRLRMLLIGLDAVVVLGLLGVHFLLTDEWNLLKKTPFGNAVCALGEPRDVMRQIDDSVMKRFELYSSFALTESWLILFYPGGWKYEPRRVCARPIRKEDIRSTEFIPEGQLDGSGRMLIRLNCINGVSCAFYIYQWKELGNLRVWLREEE